MKVGVTLDYDQITGGPSNRIFGRFVRVFHASRSTRIRGTTVQFGARARSTHDAAEITLETIPCAARSHGCAQTINVSAGRIGIATIGSDTRFGVARHGKIVHQMINSTHTRRKQHASAGATSVSINVVACWVSQAALCHITSISSALNIFRRIHEKVDTRDAREVSTNPIDIAAGLI